MITNRDAGLPLDLATVVTASGDLRRVNEASLGWVGCCLPQLPSFPAASHTGYGGLHTRYISVGLIYSSTNQCPPLRTDVFQYFTAEDIPPIHPTSEPAGKQRAAPMFTPIK